MLKVTPFLELTMPLAISLLPLMVILRINILEQLILQLA